MARYSSIRPKAAASAASVAPPMAMSLSPGSARNRSISSARLPEASRALPCTADSVVENTTFGSGFQSAAHSSSASSSDGSWSAVSQYSIVSYSRRPNRWTPTSRISSIQQRKTPSSGAGALPGAAQRVLPPPGTWHHAAHLVDAKSLGGVDAVLARQQEHLGPPGADQPRHDHGHNSGAEPDLGLTENRVIGCNREV